MLTQDFQTKEECSCDLHASAGALNNTVEVQKHAWFSGCPGPLSAKGEVPSLLSALGRFLGRVDDALDLRIELLEDLEICLVAGRPIVST